MACELAESSILELSVIGRYLGVEVDAISKKGYDIMAADLLVAVDSKLADMKRAKTKLPAKLKRYCKRRDILIESK